MRGLGGWCGGGWAEEGREVGREVREGREGGRHGGGVSAGGGVMNVVGGGMSAGGVPQDARRRRVKNCGNCKKSKVASGKGQGREWNKTHWTY